MTLDAPGPTADVMPLSWSGIVRLGLVQTTIGAIFVLATSTLNRVMVVELALPAILPGLLIALHYLTQVLRPLLGHGSDQGGRRTPWIIGGIALLSVGCVLAAVATTVMQTHVALGVTLAVPAFVMIGLGVGAAGTTLLVLIAKRTTPSRRPAAAAVAYVMMIFGFILTAIIARKVLNPYSPSRLVGLAVAIAAVGFVVTCVAVWGLEGSASQGVERQRQGRLARRQAFASALHAVWADPKARDFAVFIFVSMLAYGGEELIIEPFAGAIFQQTPGMTAALSGSLHGGSLIGMVFVGAAATLLRRRQIGSLEAWMTGGCAASALALCALGLTGLLGAPGPMAAIVFALGIANGGYAIAAIAAMMQNVGAGAAQTEGVRMGVWGAAQALAFGAGGIAATMLSDIVRNLVTWQPLAYAVVFASEAAVFLVAARLAARLAPTNAARPPSAAREVLT